MRTCMPCAFRRAGLFHLAKAYAAVAFPLGGTRTVLARSDPAIEGRNYGPQPTMFQFF